ncbi:maltose permease MAL61 [Aspergillus udagawae]|nr:maltose permease MAL61 [Aspergillus udagawae]
MSNSSAAGCTLERQEIDRILRAKRQQRTSKACYPCRSRKVKCDNGHPCRTCQKRGHPQICVYDLEESSPRKRAMLSPQNSNADASHVALPSGLKGANDQPPIRNSASPLHTRPASESIVQEDPFNYVFSGENTVISMLGSHDTDGSITHKASSVLGLQNSFSNYPFLDLKTPVDRWKALVEILPQREEILKFFHFYRTSAHPFNPILVDIDGFELVICQFLASYASGELCDSDKVSERWSSDRSVGQISLLLATLASGAHYSDLVNPERSEKYQSFARRSFQALRLANFLLRPSLEVVQSLLILGNTLQNNGQSDGAWALLGTTARLAQTLGLHTEKSISRWPEPMRPKAKALCLLSLCYDRPSMVSTRGWQLDSTTLESNLSYTDMMHYLCRLGLQINNAEERERNYLDFSLKLLAALDNVFKRVQPHLLSREQCTSLHQHLEHLALRIHVSFCVSVLCRPAIKRPPRTSLSPRLRVLRNRAKDSLVEAAKAFLDFETLSIVPLRTWSMVHTVLSSALLLCLWEETRHEPVCRDLQQRVIEVFSRVGTTGTDANGQHDNRQWLSTRHVHALVALRNAVRDTPMREGDANPETQRGSPRSHPPQRLSDVMSGPGMRFGDVQPSGDFPSNFDFG